MLILNEENMKQNTVIDVGRINRGIIQYDNFGGKLFSKHISFKPNLYHSYLEDVKLSNLNKVSKKYKNNELAKKIIVEDNLSFKNTFYLPFEQDKITSMEVTLKREWT